MSESDIEDAQLVVMIRTMDAWFLLDPQVTYDAVTTWLDSIRVHADPVSACCAGNTGGAQHEGCIYPMCRCACHVEASANEVTEADVKHALGLPE